MKEIELDIKDTYKNVVEFIRDNFDISEPTIFKFTKIVETNAKMRRKKQFKNIYKYETDGIIKLNDNFHKENLFRKCCMPTLTQKINFEELGID